MEARAAAVLLLLGVTACAGLVPLARGGPGTVQGQVTLASRMQRPPEPQPVIVYLESEEDEPRYDGSDQAATIKLEGGQFIPSFLVISAGQTVEFVGRKGPAHRIFSYSTPNDFDLGVHRQEEPQSVRFRYPGVVRLYCAHHEDSSALVFVAPTRHFAQASRTGHFEMAGVRPGTYRVRTWSPRLPRASERVIVAAGHTASVKLRISGPERDE